MTVSENLTDSAGNTLDVSHVCAEITAPWDERNDQLVNLLRRSVDHPGEGEALVRQQLEQGININARNTSRQRAVQIAAQLQVAAPIQGMLEYASREGGAMLERDAAVPGTTSSPALIPANRTLSLEFHGTAGEYFRIWAVNLCLTLLTVGIFSAWAKVRKKRYFYSHTLLDNTPFQYLGEPLPILKGRIVAVVLFGMWYLGSNFFMALMPILAVIVIVLAPWVMVRSSAFNARYSAFRNMTFHFDGTYRDAASTLYSFFPVPLLIVGGSISWQWEQPFAIGAAILVFAFAFPFWLARIKRYLVSHTQFGGVAGKLDITGGNYYSIYFRAGLLGTLVSIVTGGATVGMVIVLHNLDDGALDDFFSVVSTIPVYLGYVIVYAYIQSRTTNLVWNNTQVGSVRFSPTMATRPLMALYLINAIAIVASLGLLIPWAVIRAHRYRIECLGCELQGELSEFRGSDQNHVRASGAEVGEMFDLDFSL